MNYIILKGFLDKATCNSILSSANYFNVQGGLGLLDGEDKTNTWYKSNRSPGLEYRYQRDPSTDNLQQNIKKELTSITGVDFSGGINELCLPLCKYNDGGIIKAHRDIDKINDLNKPVEYVVVCMLTQKNKDYNLGLYNEEKDRNSLDGLFINYNPDIVSSHGKDIFESPKSKAKRMYTSLNKGDVIIFRNDNSIHGVEPITVKEGQMGRITCGFRSK